MIVDRRRVDDVLAAASGLRPIAIGLATVELERAVRELAAGTPELRFVAAADDELLGACCRVSTTDQEVAGMALRLVLLEPATEGLLAAALARWGEGPAAVYGLTAGTGEPPPLRSAIGDGPLGRGRLVIGTSRFGPHVVALEQAARRPALGAARVP